MKFAFNILVKRAEVVRSVKQSAPDLVATLLIATMEQYGNYERLPVIGAKQTGQIVAL